MLTRPCEPCIYSPDGMHGAYFPPEDAPACGAILVSPMFEERRSAHRAMTEFCSGLAERNCAALHLDLAGCGNSPGSLEDTELADWARNLSDGFDFLKAKIGDRPAFLVGCRMGALIAGWYLSENADCAERFLLWSPVTAGAAYLSAARRRRMIQDQITDAEEKPDIDPREVEGQVLSESLFADLKKLALGKLPRPEGARLLQCSFNTKLTGDVRRLLEAWGGENCMPLECVVAQPFWNAHTPEGYDEIVQRGTDLLLQ